jgi:membrane protease subunit HflC
MNKRGCLWAITIFGVLLLFRAFLGCFYTVKQTEQVIVTQFGKPVGEPMTEPGLHRSFLSSRK